MYLTEETPEAQAMRDNVARLLQNDDISQVMLAIQLVEGGGWHQDFEGKVSKIMQYLLMDRFKIYGYTSALPFVNVPFYEGFTLLDENRELFMRIFAGFEQSKSTLFYLFNMYVVIDKKSGRLSVKTFDKKQMRKKLKELRRAFPKFYIHFYQNLFFISKTPNFVV